MLTKELDHAEYDIRDAALTMAMAVLVERIKSLSPEDRNDLYELSRVLFAGESDEEIDSAVRAMREILDQTPGKVQRLAPDEPPNGRLAKWLDFVSGRIKSYRVQAGLNQQQLADRCGLDAGDIIKLESGRYSPTHAILEKLAQGLNVPIDQLAPST